MTPAKHLTDLHGQDIAAERRHDPYGFVTLARPALIERHDELHAEDQWNTAAERHVHGPNGQVLRGMKQSRKAINPVSATHQDWLDDYHEKRAIAIEEADGQCKAQLYGCTQVATTAHHKAGRVGKEANNHLLPVCRSCHNQITEHKVNDYELGLSVRRVS